MRRKMQKSSPENSKTKQVPSICASSHLPFQCIGQGPVNVILGKASGLISDENCLCKAPDSNNRLPVVISLEKIICWSLNRGKIAVHNNVATTIRWPRPLHRCGRSIEVLNTAVY